MEIRKANMSDLKRIQELNNELFELELTSCDDTLIRDWPLSMDGEEYFKSLIKEDYVYVAVDDFEIVGYLAGSVVDVSYVKNKYAELNNMCVSGNSRCKKVGSLLLDRFKNDVKELGIMELRVTASFMNKNARNFYEKNGFKDFEITYRVEL